MYIPSRFSARDPDALLGRLSARLGMLVTHGPGGLYASHLPLLHDPAEGVLEGHLARANGHHDQAGDGEALVVFQGAEAYVSPAFYPSKARDPRRVPTWGYEAVHVYGRLEWFDGPAALRDLVARLSDRHEARRAEPWSVDDAPDEYIARMLRGIVGLRLHMTRVEAKEKLSQDKPAPDRDGATRGLAGSSDQRDRELAEVMADRER